MNLKLLQLREEKNLSQDEVASILNVTRQAYSRYERGERELGYVALTQLAKFFDVSIDYLLGSSEYFYPDTIQLSSSENFAKRSTDNTYSSIEKELIEEFRKLPESSKQLVLRMVGINAAEQTKKKKA